MTDMYNNYRSNVLPNLLDSETFVKHNIYLNQHVKGTDKKFINYYHTCVDNSRSYLVLRNTYGKWNLHNLNLLASILKLPNKTRKMRVIRFNNYKDNLHVYNYNWSIKLLNHYFDGLHPFNFIEHNDEGNLKKTPVGTGKIFYNPPTEKLLKSTFKFIEVRQNSYENNKHILINLDKLLCPDGERDFKVSLVQTDLDDQNPTHVYNLWSSSDYKTNIPDPSKKNNATLSFEEPTHKEVLMVLSEILYKSTISPSDVKDNLLHLTIVIIMIIMIVMIITKIINF